MAVARRKEQEVYIEKTTASLANPSTAWVEVSGSPICVTGIKAESDSVNASTRTQSFNRQHSSCCETGKCPGWRVFVQVETRDRRQRFPKLPRRTLDGPPRTHDQFRIYPDGQGSFEKIARNIVLALDRGVIVSIRVNVCKDNLGDLPGLAMEATQRGWTNYKNFRIYVAPIQPTANFPNNGRLLNSYQLGQSLQKMQQGNQLLNVIETPDDNMKRRALALFQQPEIDPIADFKASFCGAHSGMYIFDPFGDIYACWEKMGDPQIRIGRIGTDNKFVYELPMFQKWRSRTVATNPTCESCSYALQCGGGCAALAEAKNGTYFSNFCDGFGARFKSAVADAYEAFLTEQENPSGFSELAMATNSFETEPGCL
jgi:radical SAM protein with 4Fe4S-binding SPASM domain